jgi:hypothetical protein
MGINICLSERMNKTCECIAQLEVQCCKTGPGSRLARHPMEVRLAELPSDEGKRVKTTTTVKWTMTVCRCHSVSKTNKKITKSNIRTSRHKYKKVRHPSSQ